MNMMGDSSLIDLLVALIIIAVAIVSNELMLGIIAVLLLRIIILLSDINQSIQNQKSLSTDELLDD